MSDTYDEYETTGGVDPQQVVAASAQAAAAAADATLARYVTSQWQYQEQQRVEEQARQIQEKAYPLVPELKDENLRAKVATYAAPFLPGDGAPEEEYVNALVKGANLLRAEQQAEREAATQAPINEWRKRIDEANKDLGGFSTL